MQKPVKKYRVREPMHNKFKRLAIISDCVHMHDSNGNVATENHIFSRQMEALASYFEHTILCCPFVNKKSGSVTSTYSLDNIEFIQLPNVGGNTLKHKFQIIKTIPSWIRAFRKAFAQSDLVYLRMPNNLNIPGFFYFYFKHAKTFATYTGTWKNYKGEPLTYRFQKWVLKHFFKGPVWIYTDEECIQKNFLKNYSPSYSMKEWQEKTEQVNSRIIKYKSYPINKPVFITVGSLVSYKNQQYILEVCKHLHEKNFSFYWYIVGDGPLKSEYAKFAGDNNLNCCVSITGKKTYQELRELYRKANFLVQATLVEGFGKAPVEAMFHGVIPILSKVAMANEMSGNGSRGYVFSVNNIKNLECLIYKIMGEQDRLVEMIENGRKYAKEQTLENWAKDYVQTINIFFKKLK